jgi:hypothetical protein
MEGAFRLDCARGQAMGKNQHVVMHDDRWAVKEEGASDPVALFRTQGQAW